MTTAQYVCVSCFATGAPWSEQNKGKLFDVFMSETFGTTIASGVPSQGQDMEFQLRPPISEWVEQHAQRRLRMQRGRRWRDTARHLRRPVSAHAAGGGRHRSQSTARQVSDEILGGSPPREKT